MESSRKEASGGKHGKHIKARTTYNIFLVSKRQAYHSIFFLLTYTDLPTMLSRIFFSVLHFLKKIYSISTTIILNRVIIFYNPLNTFWRWHFWLSEINVTGSWELWTADQLYLWCFAFKQCVTVHYFRYVCKTVSWKLGVWK